VAKTVNIADIDISNDRGHKRVSWCFNQKCDILENVNLITFSAGKESITFCETRLKGASNLKQLHSLILSSLQSYVSFFTSRFCVCSDHSTSV